MFRGIGVYAPDRVIAEWRLAPEANADEIVADLRVAREKCATIDGAFVWVGLFEPSHTDLDVVCEQFAVPRLLADDAGNPAQRAKFEVDADGHGLALLKTLDYVEGTADVRTGQLSALVGPGFVLTIRFGDFGDLDSLRRRVAAQAHLREQGPHAVLYAVLDSVVDRYVEVVDRVGYDIETLETEVFAGDPLTGIAPRIYHLKRETVEMRRALAPVSGWAQDAIGERIPWVPANLAAYYRDIGDHLLRALDTVESADNLLMTMLMASTSLQDLQQNRDMRKISAWVAIAAVPTAVAAIYGMNFDYMPELHWVLGYPATLLVMAVICGLLFRAFKRSGWL